jgi:glycosyltransferase involved in cell wall biosynthesis
MRKKIRVMHVIGSLVAGGCERMFLTNLAGLEDRGRVENIGLVVSSRLELLEGWKSDAKLICLRIRPYGSKLLDQLMLFHELPRVAWAFLDERPDVVYIYHVHLPTWAMLFFLCRVFGKRLVVRKMIESVQGAHDFSLYRLSDCAVTVFGGGVRQLAERGVPPGKISHIPNGKDLSLYRSRLGGAEAKARLGLKKGNFIIGMLSRLDPIKNHQLAIRALSRLPAASNARLVIAGDDPARTAYKENLRSLIRSLNLEGRVVFLGHRNDIAEVLASFDVFVHPSLREGCPGAVLEAMCAGLPIVASDAGGSAELLGESGILIRASDDGAALSSALKRLMADGRLRTALGRKARARAERRFSLDAMLCSYERLFDELAGAAQAAKIL